MAGSNGPKVVTDGLVRCYDLSQYGGWGRPETYDTSGFGYFYSTGLKDFSRGGGSLYNLEGFNGALFTVNGVRCRITKGTSFSSPNFDNYFQDRNYIPIGGNSARTVELWTYLGNATGRSDDYGNSNVLRFTCIRWGTQSGYAHCGFGVYSDNQLMVHGYGQSTTHTYSPTVPSLLNRWVQMAFTSSGSNVIFYLNGESIGTGTFAFNTDAFGGLPAHYLRSVNIVSFWGYECSTRVYNRQLSAAEIKRNFNAQRGRFSI